MQIVVGASAVLKKYGSVEDWLKDDGIKPDARVTMTLEGGSNVAMVKTAGLGMIEFSSLLESLNPDLVVVRGDRYEILPIATAAAYMNKTIAHIEGGDLTGTIDESVRHAVTKLSHIHFATNEASRERIIGMGENPRFVFNVGSPDVELVAKNRAIITNKDLHDAGVGTRPDIKESFLIVMQHPVTTEMDKNMGNVEETLRAVCDLKMPTIWFWPNIDAGTDEVSGVMRRYREETGINNHTLFLKHLPPAKFISLLKKCSCLAGNSSCGIKECSYLGIPVVNIGTRQDGRMRAYNVVDVEYNRHQIRNAIKKQLEAGRYAKSNIYYKKDSSKEIADILAHCDLYIQKKFHV